MEETLAPGLLAAVSLERAALDPMTRNAVALHLLLYGRDFSTYPLRAELGALLTGGDGDIMHAATAAAYLHLHNAALQAGGANV